MAFPAAEAAAAGAAPNCAGAEDEGVEDLGGKVWGVADGVEGGPMDPGAALPGRGVAESEGAREVGLAALDSSSFRSLAGGTLRVTIYDVGSSVISRVFSRPNRRAVRVSWWWTTASGGVSERPRFAMRWVATLAAPRMPRVLAVP